MTDPLASTQPAPVQTVAIARRPGVRRRLWAAIGLASAAVVVVIVLIVAGGGSAQPPPATGAASIVPADALAYVNLSLDRARPAVRQALAVAGRFPDYPLAAAAVLSRLGTILGGGRSIDVSTQVEPWLGDEAALALLNTPTSTAGTLIILRTSDQARARAFIRAQGATSHGVYRGTTVFVYPSGSELAFVDGFLLLGQDASVRAAIDVATGAGASLASASVYQRAAATEPADRVLDAYASVDGVRRLLAPQGGIIGALGGLLYQPALEGVTVALSPTAGGARVQVHSALDPQLARLSTPATTAFSPSLQNVMPTGSILMLDVSGLDRIAPQVLNAGATAGVAGDIGPLLSRLGTALTAEGVDVSSIVSIFHREAAVAIVPHAQTPTLVIVARAPDQAKVRTELAELEIPLAQLFKAPASASGDVPVFNDRQIGAVTARQLVLTSGLQLDYAVFNGLVVISTSLQGLEAVAQQKQTLAHDPSFQFTLAHRPARVTSLVYLNFDRLLTLGQQTGLTSSATFETLRTDLEQIAAVGLSSTRGPGQSTAQISIRIR